MFAWYKQHVFAYGESAKYRDEVLIIDHILPGDGTFNETETGEKLAFQIQHMHVDPKLVI